MRGLIKAIRDLAIPDLPRDVREDFVVSAAMRVQRQARLLVVVLFLTTPIAVLAAHPEASWLVRWGLPATMGLYCIFAFIKLMQRMDFETNPRRAERFLIETSISSGFGAVVSSLWCVLSWLSAAGNERLHFPMILVMGALATAYCLASVKLGAILNLAIDLIPISLLLIFSGPPMDFAAGVSILICAMFQWWMIETHHRHVIELLLLRRQSQQLALTDPLTGLLNRRALLDFAEALGEGGEPCRMMLIDIDHFKAINDSHGHNMGDAVLAEIAAIIDARGGNNVSAARLGGEEFALLGSLDALPEAAAMALLTEIRTHPFAHGEQMTVSIGIAEGPLDHGIAWRRLYAAADTALYAAKQAGRNRACHAAELDDDSRPDPRAARPGRAVA